MDIEKRANVREKTATMNEKKTDQNNNALSVRLALNLGITFILQKSCLPAICCFEILSQHLARLFGNVKQNHYSVWMWMYTIYECQKHARTIPSSSSPMYACVIKCAMYLLFTYTNVCGYLPMALEQRRSIMGVYYYCHYRYSHVVCSCRRTAFISILVRFVNGVVCVISK